MPKAAPPIRLLLAHPDEAARTFMRRRFARLGYEVGEAGSAAQALQLASAGGFDLALVDLQICGDGGEDGLELVRRLRALPSPPAVLALAEAAEDGADALAEGADDCLTKPLYLDLAHARIEMLVEPRSGARARKGELQARVESLEAAAVRTEALSAALVELGLDAIAPINGLLGAASAITALCRTPGTKRPIERIEAAAAALDEVMVRALGRADRRARTPKTRLNLLLADRGADGRGFLDGLLERAQVEVELTTAAGGSQAVLATDTRFFDLIVMSIAGPEEIAGVQAIRRAERQNRTRRTPILAVGPKAPGATEALAAGADLYVQAPVTAERLLGALADALARESEEVRAVA